MGPQEIRYVGAGKNATVLPVVPGQELRGLCTLRLVCKGFREALGAVPLHVTARTADHVCNLAISFFKDCNIVAVHLVNAGGKMQEGLMDAACALPVKDRRKVVSLDVSGVTVANIAQGLRLSLELRYNDADCTVGSLSHLKQLDMREIDFEKMVGAATAHHATYPAIKVRSVEGTKLQNIV